MIACHCTQCRKTSGHVWAATSAACDDIHFDRRSGLQWFRASDTAQRGFCAQCGSSLFWRPDGQDRMAIAAGSLHAPTGLTLSAHVFCADKGTYYTLPDQIPQFSHFSGEENA